MRKKKRVDLRINNDEEKKYPKIQWDDEMDRDTTLSRSVFGIRKSLFGMSSQARGMPVRSLEFTVPVQLEFENQKTINIDDWFIKTEWPLVKITNRKTRKVYWIPFTNVSSLGGQ